MKQGYRLVDCDMQIMEPRDQFDRDLDPAFKQGVTSSRRAVGATVELLGGTDNICVSGDFLHFDSSFPDVSKRALTNPSITPEIGGKILGSGARLYGFGEDDFARAAAAAKWRDNIAAGRA
jgi:hypothetical protein